MRQNHTSLATLASQVGTICDPRRAPILALPAPVGFHCPYCFEYSDPDGVAEGRDGIEYCESCWDDMFYRCAECDAVFDNESDDHGRCPECHDNQTFTCEGCNCEHERFNGWGGSNVHTSDNGDEYCESCHDETFFYCEGCDSERYQSDYGSDGLCVECDGSNLIHEYSYKVHYALSPFGTKGLMGVELEVECGDRVDRRDAARSVLDVIGDDFVALKEDSSLNRGFEIVSAPATLSHHAERWPRMLGGRHTKRGLRSFDTSTCGMHVHYDRASISPLTLGKILLFVHNPANGPAIESLAGRSLHHGFGKLNAHRKATDQMNNDRYEAVNLQNRNTVEFRIFRGTLDKDGFMKNLESVHAIVAFCAQSGIRQVDWRDFVRWVGLAPKDYPHLVAWLRARGDLTPIRPRPVATVA